MLISPRYQFTSSRFQVFLMVGKMKTEHLFNRRDIKCSPYVKEDWSSYVERIGLGEVVARSHTMVM